jgi:hypothetical protein
MGFTKKEQDDIDGLNEGIKSLGEEGLKERLDSMSKEQLKAYIGQVALNEITNQLDKEGNQELTDAKDKVKGLNEPYKEITKSNKVRIEYAKYLVDGLGG